MDQRTRRGWAVTVAGLLVALAVAPAAHGANREYQQLMADLRMLQEQTQVLQVTLNALTEALKVVTTRMDEQAGTTRKAFADQRLLVETVNGDVRVLREKLDETNVRLSSLSQEMEAVRTTMTTPPPAPPAPTADGYQTPTDVDPVQPAPVSPAAAGLSPQRMYDSAYADFASGQYSLAILGFETFVKTFPRTEQADDALLYIGDAHALDRKPEQAIAAYDRVIAEYPTGDATPLAYYKRGMELARREEWDKARESWQTVIDKYPDTDASRLAKQGIERLARRTP